MRKLLRAFFLASGLLVASLPAIGPAQASQSSCTLPSSGPMSMATFVGTYANPCLGAVLSKFSGTSAPGSPVQYQWWFNTTASPPQLEIYDGTSWVVVATLNSSTHVLAIPTSVVPVATASVLGLVKPDGTTLTNSTGAISVTYGSGSNTAAQGNDSRITGAAQLATTDQTLSGGANLTTFSIGTVSSGTTTIDCGKNPSQYLTNGGAFTLAAPTNDGQCIVQVENGASAGTITFSGFSVGTNTGDPLDTTNGHKFQISIRRVHSVSEYAIQAAQ